MKLIARYLIRQLSVMTVYALLAFLALYLFFDLMNESGDIGKGTYTGFKAMQYLVLQIPAHVYELMPLAVLIGGLLALNQLAAGSEITVMKTSGMSTGNLIGVLLSFGAVFALATAALGEWGAPAASRSAENMKAAALSGGVSAGAGGVWIKEGGTIVNVAEMLPDRTLRGITAYRHDGGFKLAESWQAESAVVGQNGMWRLYQVRRTLLADDAVSVSQSVQEDWQAGIDGQLLDVLLVDPAQMSVSALGAYIGHLEQNRQQTGEYRIAWWRKLMYPVATVVMALVALAFTPQSTRHGNMGLKLFGGICLGLAFHFAGRLFGFSGELYGMPPFLAAALPTLIFAAWAVYLIRKQEKR
ncbi:LPS export ABC transporter permease LptG [Neisseria leonii]|uniref:LPS export ABC transporter permease LptG n=1 Tax=Neisseria leonii TaxID=2995413 RepID=UPI00237C3300|nr:LPS export ABC transporter permease LptG [Neisseria sp. 3986]MDD9325236.1 LPS export ABC transporter permease LptG [Neisseria sp. 3986]